MVSTRQTTSIVLCICCCLSAAHSQFLEKTLYLPDSLGGLVGPRCLVYDSVNNTIYVGGAEGNCVIALMGPRTRR